jgi:RNA polymerase sigma-70 factor (ECF subfamily)
MQALDRFLKEVQQRAFVTAKLATSNDDDALDLVQDSMLKLARYYSEKDSEDWPKLFQRILQNNIKDWYRKQKVRSVLFWWQQHDKTEEQLMIEAQDMVTGSPVKDQQNQQIHASIYQAIEQLPRRQQQAFVLRAWWEHSTEETAQIMGCSQGSVKTHYSRATAAMADLLKEAVNEYG